MSDTNSVYLCLAGTEPALAEASRYAHGNDIIAKLKLRTSELKADAERWIPKHAELGFKLAVASEEGVIEACVKFTAWLEELSGCDVARSSEGTMPNP